VKTITILIAFLLVLSYCTKKLDRTLDNDSPTASAGYTEYIIEAGAHYTSANSYKQISGRKEIRFIAWFDSSCIYTSTNPVNQGDINKLYGFGDCSSGHQQSSARVGWTWNGTTFDIYAYCYISDSRQ